MADITESIIVTPSEETPKHKIWLSNLDIVAPRAYTPVLYIYPPVGRKDYSPAETLKAALAKTLVILYPLAGRVSRDPQTGRPEIDCTGEGVKFNVANLDATLDDFKNFKPSAEMRKKLVPVMESADPPCPVTALQITHLKCGGIILGFTNHHYIIDGSSFSVYLKTLSAFARGDTGSIPAPFLDRSALRARSPPSVSFDHSDYTLEVQQSNILTSNTSEVVYANFMLTKDQVHSLKIHAGRESVSTFCAVVAHAWRCICIARGLPSDVETQLFFLVDLRRRMKPPLALTYIGNGYFRTKVVAKVEDLVSNKLEFGASLIKKAIDDVTDEFVRSLIDHLESMDLEALSKRGSMSKTAVMAISWLSVPMNGVDCGWGEPILVTRAQFIRGGYVYLSKAPVLDDAISLTVGLEPDSLQCFKKLLFLQDQKGFPTVNPVSKM